MENRSLFISGALFFSFLAASFFYENRDPDSRPLNLAEAISAAQDHLTHMLQPDGRFTYRQDLNSERNIKEQYNSVRHAGAIYSLAMYEDQFPSELNRKNISLAAHYLADNFMSTVRGGSDRILAILTTEETDEGSATKAAHLGGTGLGLVALLSAEKIHPGTTNADTLKSLGRFLLFMQKENGSFYSRYRPDGSRDDSNPSLYYPGESILALVMLYEWDHDLHWLSAAENGMAYLIKTRMAAKEAPPDNWAMIATAKLWPYQSFLKQLRPKDLLQHAELIARKDMDGQINDKGSPIYGCFTGDGRTTPTATRLEGLLSVYSLFDVSNKELKSNMLKSIHSGIAFLLHSQISSGSFAGAIPKAVLESVGHSTEIRIDYIQHAMSAFIRFRNLEPQTDKYATQYTPLFSNQLGM